MGKPYESRHLWYAVRQQAPGKSFRKGLMGTTETDDAIAIAEDLLESIPDDASKVTPDIHAKVLKKAQKLKSAKP